MAPVLGEDVSRVQTSGGEAENDHPGGDCFPNTVEGKHGVALVELGMRGGGAVNNRFVVTKHAALGADGHAQAAQGGAQVNDLLHAGPCSHEFRSAGGCLNRGSFLGAPIDGGLVDEVEDAHDRSSGGKVVEEVRIHKVGESDGLAQRLWGTSREFFRELPADFGPIALVSRDVRVVWFINPDANDGLTHLGDAADNSLDAIKVTTSGCSSETGHGHDSDLRVEATNGDEPLEGANEGLMSLDAFLAEQLRRIQFWAVPSFQWGVDI